MDINNGHQWFANYMPTIPSLKKLNYGKRAFRSELMACHAIRVILGLKLKRHIVGSRYSIIMSLIRNISIIWFVFMFFNFYILDIHDETFVVLLNIWWGISKNHIENQTTPNLVMVIKSGSELHVCWFLSWIHGSFRWCSLLHVK